VAARGLGKWFRTGDVTKAGNILNFSRSYTRRRTYRVVSPWSSLIWFSSFWFFWFFFPCLLFHCRGNGGLMPLRLLLTPVITVKQTSKKKCVECVAHVDASCSPKVME
jgi:hypothetical protein